MNTHIITGFDTPFRTRVELVRQSFAPTEKKTGPRLAFITGLHGDELEGLYVAHRLLQFLKNLNENDPGALLGEVHVYPAVNPPAINHASRLWPGPGIDMNRTLGMKHPESLTALWAQSLFKDVVRHADLAVDFHASNLHLRELPQVRVINEFSKSVLPLALHTNTDLVWVHPMADLFASTLGYNLNKSKVPALVIEAGICHRLTPEYGNQMFAGLVHLMKENGILAKNVTVPGRIKNPLEIRANQVISVSARRAGFFIPEIHIGDVVGEDRVLGTIIDPVKGDLLEEIKSPGTGLLFTLREHPMAGAGSLVARIALEKEPPP